MWEKAPDAEPDGMTLYFFPFRPGEGQVWRFDIAGRDGGPVKLPPGCYRLLAYNNDLPGVGFSDRDSFDGFTAFPREDGEGLVRQPGMLYSGNVSMVTVTECGVEYLLDDGSVKSCGYGLVRCWPESLSTVYTIEVRNVEGIEYVRSVAVKLSGLAGGLRLVDDTSLGGPVSETGSLSAVRDRKMLTGVLTGFGSSPECLENQLTIVVTRSDGKTFSKTVDVTSQILNSSDLKNVLIIVDGLDIPGSVTPPEEGDDVGIEVGVDGWDDITIEWNTDSPDW